MTARPDSAPAGARPLDEWLAERYPTPPRALLARLREVLPPGVVTPDVCLRAGESLVERLLEQDCAARGSALDLLVADALVTYAFEVAAEDPTSLEERAARAMLRIAAFGDEPTASNAREQRGSGAP